MQPLRNLLVAAVAALSSPAWAGSIEIEVNGLVCAFCAQGIEKSLRRFAATQDVWVSLEHRLVAVALKDGRTIDEARLRQAITDAGYATVKVAYSDDSLDAIRARVRQREAADD